jgi:hypothetical protein
VKTRYLTAPNIDTRNPLALAALYLSRAERSEVIAGRSAYIRAAGAILYGDEEQRSLDTTIERLRACCNPSEAVAFLRAQ